MHFGFRREIVLVGGLAWLLVAALGHAVAGEGQSGAGKVQLQLELSSASLARGSQAGLEVFAIVERGWHIQGPKPREKYLIPTELRLDVPPGISVGKVRFPPPDEAEFAFAPGKRLLVYEGKVGIATEIEVAPDFGQSRAAIRAVLRYQACNDRSCLPPATASAEIVVPVAAAAAEPELRPGGAEAVEGEVGQWFVRHGLGVTLLLVVLLGVGLNLTPCVYPLISVTVSFFGGQARGSPRRVAALAVAYVSGIAVTFSALGAMAGLTGGLFGSALQKPLVLAALAAVLVALALSYFGLYHFQLPPPLARRLGSAPAGIAGALLMGLTMGLVAAPCVGPAVVGLLVFVGSRQDPLLGWALFFALATGLGLPYLGLAIAAGSLARLPRAGEWLAWVEHGFGVALLALAAYFISPLLPGRWGELSVPAVVAAGGIFLGFLDRAGGSLRGFRVVQRAAGMSLVVLAAWMGWPQAPQGRIRWQPYSQEAFAAARRAGFPVVLDFYAEWCLPCKEMEKTTFADPEVAREAEYFRTLRADLTEESEETDALARTFGVKGVPTAIFFSASGREVVRLLGFISRDEMLAAMRRARADGAAPPPPAASGAGPGTGSST